MKVVASSVDPIDKAQEVADEVNFPIGYGLTKDTADLLGSWWEDRRQIIQPSEFDVLAHEVPSANNPFGFKGAGEAGTVGALPAVMNAVCDALRPLGIRHLDMPATAERIWQAIRAADAGNEA